MAALTHQSVVIDKTLLPSEKKGFPKLRHGTADSTQKFMMRLFDMIQQQGHRFHFDSLNSSVASSAGLKSSMRSSKSTKSGKSSKSASSIKKSSSLEEKHK